MSIPAVRAEAVKGAALYADRCQMIRELALPQGGHIAEIGVAHGEFTDFLIRTLTPAHFHAIDLFDGEKYPMHWGVPQEVLFHGKTHYDFYCDRFASLGDRITVLKGASTDTALKLPDGSLDMIYIDANHTYQEVSQEASICAQKIKPDGVLIFNDYILYDAFNHVEYGVIQAVNEMLDTNQWRVVGFALDKSMFCDIAIKRM